MINIFAPTFDPCDSYGRIANELSAHLHDMGVHVNHFGPLAPEHVIKPSLGGLKLGYPTMHKGFNPLAHLGKSIALTMFESEVLPEGWVEALNQCEAVIVPCRWNEQTFRDNGVNVPIYVVPLGVSEPFFDVRKREPDTPMRFLTIGDRGQRKGWQQAMRAFNLAFGDDMDYELICKVRDSHMQITNPNIHVLEGDFSDSQMVDLYHSCHVMLFPSMAEGFGLPPREFAATGGVAMATNFGGLADEMDQWGVSIDDYTLVPAWEANPEWAGKLGTWADVNCYALAEQLKRVVTYYPEYAGHAVDAAAFCRATYDWQKTAESVYDIWTSLTEVQHGSNRRTTHAPAV